MFYKRYFSTWNVNDIKKCKRKKQKIFNLHRKSLCCGEAAEHQLWSLHIFLHSLSAVVKKQNGKRVTSENICLHYANMVGVGDTAEFSRMTSWLHLCPTVLTDHMYKKSTTPVQLECDSVVKCGTSDVLQPLLCCVLID